MDIENLTKEELAEIMADPRLAKVYKSMQADYTTKTQGVADTSKKMTDLEAQLAEANDLLSKWDAYGEYAAPIVKQFTDGGFARGDITDGGDPSTRTKRSTKGNDEVVARLEALETFADKATQEMNESLGQLNKMFNYSVELNEIQFARFNEMGFKDANGKDLKFDLDAAKVIKLAMDKKLPSLKDAYDTTYKDEFVKTAAEKRAEEIVKERDAKRHTEEGEHAETKKGETVFKLDPTRPKGFGDATEQALKETPTSSDKGGLTTGEK